MKVSNRWMMAGVLAVYLSPVAVQGLVGFPEQGVEWLLLLYGTVKTS
ncbi:MAG: hypothetical protein ACMG6E_10070 [Candidatus Roizmanbacteria bacterium]